MHCKRIQCKRVVHYRRCSGYNQAFITRLTTFIVISVITFCLIFVDTTCIKYSWKGTDVQQYTILTFPTCMVTSLTLALKKCIIILHKRYV